MIFLCLRTKIDWLMPNLLQTDKIVEGIAKIYHDGDKSKNRKKHRWPIMNSKPRASSGLSKVIYRKSNEEARLSFLVQKKCDFNCLWQAFTPNMLFFVFIKYCFFEQITELGRFQNAL